MEEKRQELLDKIDNAETIEQLDEVAKEVEAIEEVKEEPVAEEVVESVEEQSEETTEKVVAEEQPKEITISTEEERNLIRTAVEVEQKNNSNMEERKMENEKVLRSAWAKRVMGLAEDKFTEEEKRALGDAVTTTATSFVESAEGTQGINNGGLFIPKSVREDLMQIMADESPIFRDVRKLAVNGNVDLAYIFASDDANWGVELTDSINEGIEFKNLQLTGHELYKDIVITWKAEEMTAEGFIDYLLQELVAKMGDKLIDAVIYGTGSGMPSGITHGLTPVETEATDSVVDKIVKGIKSLNKEAKRGAKVYVSVDANLDLIGYKDDNGGYPFLNGVGMKGLQIEVDPFLTNDDIVIGNMNNYVLNENQPIRIDKETSVKGRKVIYGAYAIYDGKAKPNSFAYITTPVSA